MLCRQAGSTDPVIIRREPHRRNPPSPHTLDRWARDYRKEGMSIFVREESGAEMGESDQRLARITREAVEWIQEHWRDYHSPHRLYLDWKVERVFRTVSEWEKDAFDEYCGSNPESRPERLKQMFSQQQAFERGRRESSPLISWEEYQAKLAQFIADFNQTPHERTNLEGGVTVIPQAEYLRLYRTRYDISPETVSLLLMKTDSRVLQKNGVNCRQLSGEPETGFESPMTEPERIHRLTRFAPGSGMTASQTDQAAPEIMMESDVAEINKVIVTPPRRVWVNEVDDE